MKSLFLILYIPSLSFFLVSFFWYDFYKVKFSSLYSFILGFFLSSLLSVLKDFMFLFMGIKRLDYLVDFFSLYFYFLYDNIHFIFVLLLFPLFISKKLQHPITFLSFLMGCFLFASLYMFFVEITEISSFYEYIIYPLLNIGFIALIFSNYIVVKYIKQLPYFFIVFLVLAYILIISLVPSLYYLSMNILVFLILIAFLFFSFFTLFYTFARFKNNIN